MIHEQHYVREVLYKWLGVVDGPRDTYKFLFYVFDDKNYIRHLKENINDLK